MAQPARTLTVPPSFEEVYESCFDMVWRLAAHRGVPASQLDDAVQEVFMVVHRQLPGFEGRASVRTWVGAITRWTVRDFLKKKAHRSSGGELPPLASEAPDPAEALERTEALWLLDEALARMNDEQREAFLLCELEGMTSREVAEELGSNANTIRTRLRAARTVFTAGVARARAQQRWRLGDG